MLIRYAFFYIPEYIFQKYLSLEGNQNGLNIYPKDFQTVLFSLKYTFLQAFSNESKVIKFGFLRSQ
jgi:hypothetical protein